MVQNVESVDAELQTDSFRIDGEVLADSEIEVEVAGTTQVIARANLKPYGSPVLVEGSLRIPEAVTWPFCTFTWVLSGPLLPIRMAGSSFE